MRSALRWLAAVTIALGLYLPNEPWSAHAQATVRAVTGTLGAATSAPSTEFSGYFSVNIWGTFSATAVLEKSYDGGTTWLAAQKDTSTAAPSWTAAASVVIYEPESGVLYRIRCSAYTSGTISWRISQ